MNNTGINTTSRRLLNSMNDAYEEAKRAAEEAEYAAAKAREAAAAASKLAQSVVAGHKASLERAKLTGNYRGHRSKMGGSRRGRKGRKSTRRGRK